MPRSRARYVRRMGANRMGRSYVIEVFSSSVIVLLLLGGGVAAARGYPEALVAAGTLAGVIAVISLLGIVMSNVIAKRAVGSAPVSPGGTIRLQESLYVGHPPELVWSVIEPPEMSPLLDPRIRRGYRVPGTPSGVGEQHAAEMLDGSVQVIEVLSLVPGRRAVTSTIEQTQSVPTRNVAQVERAAGGTVYSEGIEVDLPAGSQLAPDFEHRWRAETRRRMSAAQTVADHVARSCTPT